MKHLWEYDHPYYGADGYSNKLESFADLRASVDGADEDMNLVYRFDWEDDSQPHRDDCFLDGEDRSGQRLTIHALMPRKSQFITWTCPISHDQEHEVIEWLRGPRIAGHLRKLWAPILGEPTDAPAVPGADRPIKISVQLDQDAIRAAIDAAVRTAVEQHRDRWYAQGWHDAKAVQG